MQLYYLQQVVRVDPGSAAVNAFKTKGSRAPGAQRPASGNTISPVGAGKGGLSKKATHTLTGELCSQHGLGWGGTRL